MSASEAADPPLQPRQVYMALPSPNTDSTAIFHACQSDLARMVHADTGPSNGTHAWEQAARTAIRTGLRTRDTLDERFFDALINAGVYDPTPAQTPSSSGQP
jgi:hypothetical protein